MLALPSTLAPAMRSLLASTPFRSPCRPSLVVMLLWFVVASGVLSRGLVVERGRRLGGYQLG